MVVKATKRHPIIAYGNLAGRVGKDGWRLYNLFTATIPITQCWLIDFPMGMNGFGCRVETLVFHSRPTNVSVIALEVNDPSERGLYHHVILVEDYQLATLLFIEVVEGCFPVFPPVA